MRIYIPVLLSLLFLNMAPRSAPAQTAARVADFYFEEAGISKYDLKDVAVLPDSSVLIATGYRIEFTDSTSSWVRPRRESGGGLIWLDKDLEKKREYVWPDYSVEKIVCYGDRIFLCGNNNAGSWRYDLVWVAEIDPEGKLLRETQICRHCPYSYVQDMQADSSGNLYVLLVKEREYARERMREAWLPAENGDTTLQRYPSDVKDVMQLWRISAAGKPAWHKTLTEPNYEGFADGRLHVTGRGFDITYYDKLTDRNFHTWLSADRKIRTQRPLDREEIYFTNAGMLIWGTDTRMLELYEGKTQKAYAMAPPMAYRHPKFLLDRPEGGYLAFGFDEGLNLSWIWLDKDLRLETSGKYSQERETDLTNIALLPDGSVLVLSRPHRRFAAWDAPSHIELLRLRP